MPMPIRTLLLCALLAPVLSACGQKGALFAPPSEPPLTGASFEAKEQALQEHYWHDATTELRTRH